MKNEKFKDGFIFTNFKKEEKPPFDRLLEIFQELVTHTSGDVDEALDWMRELDKEYKLTTQAYTLDDFIEELKEKGYLKEDKEEGKVKITPKTEQGIRQKALNQIFGNIRKSGLGNHQTKQTGKGDEITGEFRNFVFGDSLESISMQESIKNAQINHGVDHFRLTEKDLIVGETNHKAQMSTVLMIDISHSMILYGEDRITPAKKVAMALAELIKTRYPKDSLDIIVFGNDAWPIKLKDLPYLTVGPYHTNTVAGISLAMDLLRRKKQTNKQIFMITDGKPSCLKLPSGEYYKNSAGLDARIVSKLSLIHI